MNKRIEELEIDLIALKTEFESFKAYHDKIVEHLNPASESKEAEITPLTWPYGGLIWVKYIATDKDGAIVAFLSKPERDNDMWLSLDYDEEITSEQAIELCGRVPSWKDEPIPVRQ